MMGLQGKSCELHFPVLKRKGGVFDHLGCFSCRSRYIGPAASVLLRQRSDFMSKQRLDAVFKDNRGEVVDWSTGDRYTNCGVVQLPFTETESPR